MKITLEQMDPIPIHGGLVKLTHHHKIGDRVIVEGIHHGKITNLDNSGDCHVLLDSGHYVHARRHDVVPEDFPQSSSGRKIAFSAPREKPFTTRAAKALDAFGFLDDSDAEESDLRKALDSAPVENGDGLRRALESDRVSIADRVRIESALEKITRGAFATNGLDVLSDGPHNFLRIMAEKYATAHAGDAFTKGNRSFVDGLVRAIDENTIDPTDRAKVIAELDGFRKGYSTSRAALERLAAKYSDRLEKRMRPGLRVGTKVRGIHAGELGKLGTIESIDGPLVKVRFDDGSGESATLLNATMETLIPVEA